jgi:hypothetical protein
MPNWLNRPPDDDCVCPYRIRRTPTSGYLQGIVLSDDLLGCNTHFFRGRTMPCEAPNCLPCTEGVPWRYHSYLASVQYDTNVAFLLELTAQASDSFLTYRKTHGTLRGCLFRAQRATPRPNGRVVIQTKPADLSSRVLPDEPNLIKLLCHIWNVPIPEMVDAPHHRENPRVARSVPDESINEGNGHFKPEEGIPDHVLSPSPSPEPKRKRR